MALWHAHRVSLNEVRLRARTADDIPVLAAFLLEQQAESRYPFRDPLPVPIEEFLHADDALGAWVAEVDGVPVGHVCRVGPAKGFSDADNLNSVCAVAYGCNPGDLTWVSALFVARGARGRGLGRRLLQRVVVDANRNGQHPCLEVLPVHPAAMNLYLSTGWRTVHQLQPVWLTSEAGAQGPDVNVMVLLDHQG